MDPDPRDTVHGEPPLTEGPPDDGIDARDEESSPSHAPRQPFLGEIVAHRSWWLILPVFFFALFLAAMPFFFSVERSPYRDALELHDRLCAHSDAPTAWADDLSAAGRAALADRPDALADALVCLDRSRHKTKFEPVARRQFGPNRAYVLTYMDPSTPDPRRVAADDPVPLRMLFVVESERLVWDPFGLPPAPAR
jgi:hypothetical protein